MNTIWFDITTSFNWRRPPVGIVRAEREIAKFFASLANYNIIFCRYDKRSDLYYHINQNHVHSLLSEENCENSSALIDKNDSTAVFFGKYDVYVTMGIDWDQKNYEKLFALKKTKGFKVITFCYDLIPVFFPHFCVGDVAAIFAKYFVSLAWLSDHVFCISYNTQKDFNKLLNDLGARIPDSSVIKLGCNILNSKGFEVSSTISSILSRRYILFVSTIDRRKNHEVIYRALTRIADTGGKIPHVVFVGMHGWGVENLMKDIELDPRTKGHITILNEINDSDLIALYKNALFTVYPSLYEGWGLPVAESLAYGKYCLASYASSIPEVGNDLIEYLDPYDVACWARRLDELSQNDEFIQEKEKLIKISYSPVSWTDTGAAVFDMAFKLLNINHECQVETKTNLIGYHQSL